jgi:hypothetical protein
LAGVLHLCQFALTEKLLIPYLLQMVAKLCAMTPPAKNQSVVALLPLVSTRFLQTPVPHASKVQLSQALKIAQT